MNFTIFLFYRKNEKTPEALDFTYVSGGVYRKKHQKRRYFNARIESIKKMCLNYAFACRGTRLAFPRGFEPPTYRLGGGRSIRLSYGNIFIVFLPCYFIKPNIFCQEKLPPTLCGGHLSTIYSAFASSSFGRIALTIIPRISAQATSVSVTLPKESVRPPIPQIRITATTKRFLFLPRSTF